MILLPLQNGAALKDGVWIQTRPVITQGFGERPAVYAQFGLKGHNGIDLRAETGTPIYAPFEGIAHIHDEGDKGYGKYIKITKDGLEFTIAHLSQFLIQDGQKVYMGDRIALSGGTGFVTAPHFHGTMKRLNEKGQVLDYDNGFKGAIDWLALAITWKGSLTSDNII